VALALIAGSSRDLFQRQWKTGYREGRAAAPGYAYAHAFDAQGEEDWQLGDGDMAAGAMTAKAHA
jgi:hypothetical protein